MSYAQVAARVAQDKEKNPENYCKKCLWRIKDRNGNVKQGCNNGYCPRHQIFVVPKITRPKGIRKLKLKNPTKNQGQRWALSGLPQDVFWNKTKQKQEHHISHVGLKEDCEQILHELNTGKDLNTPYLMNTPQEFLYNRY